jgi:hypothetical protein
MWLLRWQELVNRLFESFYSASILNARKQLLARSERLNKQAAGLLSVALTWPAEYFRSVKGRDLVQ